MDHSSKTQTEEMASLVETWLGNPATRKILSKVAVGPYNMRRMERILKLYGWDTGNALGLKERIVGKMVRGVIGQVVNKTGITEDNIKSNMKVGYWRKGLVSTLAGIGLWGPQKPFTSYAPFLVVWNSTNACNLHCRHCYQSAISRPTPDELTTAERLKVVDRLADEGVAYISLSGGEPLMRHDFFEVAERIRQRNMGLALATNGTMLTAAGAKRLAELGCSFVQVSLDGTGQTHDKFRGLDGTFDKTLKGIKNAVDAGLSTEVAMTVTSQNLDEVMEVIDITESLGAGTFMHYNFIPAGRGKEIMNKDLSPQQRESLLEKLATEGEKRNINVLSTAPQFSRVCMGGKHSISSLTHFDSIGQDQQWADEVEFLAEFVGGCGGGRLYCGLQPNGDIIPCVFLPEVLGNIRYNSLVDVWQNSDFLAKMRRRDAFKGQCSQCDYVKVCGGCRARAFGYFNDVQGPDPGCVRNATSWDELEKKVEKDSVHLL
ncbi:radical SAM protein [Methanohalophilus sp. RSK]|uniref:radical SAM/SPASM domain-containing protein n=1 Tax=Methanohalophilus sp. RSK TaxID=2485783 RepID=UPI000F43B5F8|nr:radical SAM protein [Methanohalophilus sp. RSK]RNI14013.1 radical SAM protein [Methanohalophilus sp. RSK]